MIPGLEMLACQDLAVPLDVMQHVVHVESSFNPYAIGVVGARLARQPRSLEEAVATAAQLEREGYNFSLGLAQVNRHNLTAQGLDNYEVAFSICPNLAAGARILADCRNRAGGDWGKAFSCYYSGNFERGFRDGYVQKVRTSMQATDRGALHPVLPTPLRIAAFPGTQRPKVGSLRERRGRSPARAAAAADGEPGPADELAGMDRRASEVRPPVDAPFVPRVTVPAGRPTASLARTTDAQASSSEDPAADSAFVF